MSQSSGRGRIAPRTWFLVPILLATLAPGLQSVEPDGPVRLHTEWIRPEAGNGPALLRLGVEPLVPLHEAELTVTVPIGFVVAPRTGVAGPVFHPVSAAPERRAIRAFLPSPVRSFHDFELTLPPNGSGVLEFIVEGRDTTGKAIRSAVGVAVGESFPRGVPRMGAMEFPAVVLPADER